METNWFYSIDNEEIGPVSSQVLKQLAKSGSIQPFDLVWKEGMSDWVEAQQIKGLFSGKKYPRPPAIRIKNHNAKEKRITAGVLAIVLGGVGVHKFYLGKTGEGVIMLLVGLVGFFLCLVPLFVTTAIGIAEGIAYLTKSDEEFYELYIVEQKGWF